MARVEKKMLKCDYKYFVGPAAYVAGCVARGVFSSLYWIKRSPSICDPVTVKTLEMCA